MNDIQKQPDINIGFLGHVANGKTTIVKALTGKNTSVYTLEKKENKTIKLGYSNVKIYCCNICPSPGNYKSTSSEVFEMECTKCHNMMTLERHLSIVDCPGHNTLIATMLNGTAIMDSTILVEAATNNNIPEIQTEEHLKVAEMMELHNSFVCMNKVDIKDRGTVREQLTKLRGFLDETDYKDSRILPLSATLGSNMDILCEFICKFAPKAKTIETGKLKMLIIRSFNVNTQNTPVCDLVGAVMGGSIISGSVKPGDKIKILPGRPYKENDKTKYKPLVAVVTNIKSENNELEFAGPGGLIGVQTTLDPAIALQDKLAGHMMVRYDDAEEYNVYDEINIKYKIIKLRDSDKKEKIKDGDQLVVNFNALNIKAVVSNFDKTNKRLKLVLVNNPICIKKDEIIILSTTMNKIIGVGMMIDGEKMESD